MTPSLFTLAAGTRTLVTTGKWLIARSRTGEELRLDISVALHLHNMTTTSNILHHLGRAPNVRQVLHLVAPYRLLDMPTRQLHIANLS